MTNPNLTPTTTLTPCYNANGQLWAVRIAKGQPGAGQFAGVDGITVWERAVARLDREFVMKLAAASMVIACREAYQRRSKVKTELRIATGFGDSEPLKTARLHSERQQQTVDLWTK